MERTKALIRLATTVASALLVAAVVRTSLAVDAPSPAASPALAPAPSLVVSDRAPLGCCCVSQDVEAGAKPGCSYGLSEDKCRVVGKVRPKWGTTWTPGKCPPAAPPGPP